MNCGHCGKPCDGDWASYNGIRVCNPDTGLGVMECYRLIRDFHHDFGCQPCKVMGGKGVTEVIDHEH